MKSLPATFTVFTVVSAYVLATALSDIYDGPTYELNTIDDSTYDETTSDLSLVRQRRWDGCLKYSWVSWLNLNYLCRNKCRSQGHRGGECRNGTCICRK